MCRAKKDAARSGSFFIENKCLSLLFHIKEIMMKKKGKR